MLVAVLDFTVVSAQLNGNVVSLNSLVMHSKVLRESVPNPPSFLHAMATDLSLPGHISNLRFKNLICSSFSLFDFAFRAEYLS